MSSLEKESWLEPYELDKLSDIERIGRIIWQARVMASLKIKDLAEKTDLTVAQIGAYEHGNAKCLPLYARIRLAKCLHISIFALLMDDEQGLRDLVTEKERKRNGKR